MLVACLTFFFITCLTCSYSTALAHALAQFLSYRTCYSCSITEDFPPTHTDSQLLYSVRARARAVPQLHQWEYAERDASPSEAAPGSYEREERSQPAYAPAARAHARLHHRQQALSSGQVDLAQEGEGEGSAATPPEAEVNLADAVVGPAPTGHAGSDYKKRGSISVSKVDANGYYYLNVAGEL